MTRSIPLTPPPPSDEYWQNHPELHDIPIYYASSLAKKCMAVYQTYVNAMNDKIRKAININNPFVFKHISNLKVRFFMVAPDRTLRAAYLASTALPSPLINLILRWP